MTRLPTYVLLILAAAALTGCSGEDAPFVAPIVPGEIVFGAEDGAATRSDVTSLTTLNFLCTNGTVGSETGQWSFSNVNVASGYFATGRYWPSAGDYLAMGGYHFYASNLYIYNSAYGVMAECIISDPANDDGLCASLINPVYGGINTLVCNHVYTKLGNVTVTPAVAGYTVSDLHVYLNGVCHVGYYCLSDGTWFSRYDARNYTVINGGASFTRLSPCVSSVLTGYHFIPGTYTVTADYRVTRGSYTYTVTAGSPKSAGVTLPSGQYCALNMTIPIDGQKEIQISVENWQIEPAYIEPL